MLSSVRMLCKRSASFIKITLGSSVRVSNIFLKFSACWDVLVSITVDILVRPSTILAISLPNSLWYHRALIGYALTVARDREKGVFQRLRVTPAPTWTIMTSRLVMQAVANLIIAVAVVIVGSLIHHISPSAGQYALVLLVSILAGAVFLSLGQALVGLVSSADSVQAVARVLFAVLILLGLLGQSGALGSFWSSVARWSPVGVVMTLFAGVLNLHAWYSRDTLSVLACLGYIVVFAGIGIRWFQWDAR